jgi:hypothetical protein
MTPKEKAQELVCKFHLVNSESVELITGEYDLLHSLSPDDAKKCALMCVDEMMDALANDSWRNRNELMFYEEVKKQIKNYESSYSN